MQQTLLAFHNKLYNMLVKTQKSTKITANNLDALSAVSAQNNLNPFLTSLGGNLATAAAAAAVANGNSGSAAANNAALLNQTIAGLQFPQLGLLNLTSVVLVSNLNEDVNFLEFLINL